METLADSDTAADAGVVGSLVMGDRGALAGAPAAGAG